MYIPRLLEPLLKKRAKTYPIISIVGPRQSGKTTLAKHAFPNHTYVNLEQGTVRLYASSDPEGFLNDYANEHGLIIDEFQAVPELLSEIMVMVDEKKKMGQFILTGSQNYLLNRKVKQSLAGRVSLNTLLPFSQDELIQANVLSESLNDVLHKGMYPPVYTRHNDSEHWYDNYVSTLVEQDIPHIQKIEDRAQFTLFLHLCAGRIGQVVNYSALGRDCGISDRTARRWLALLEKTYVAYTLKSHHRAQRKKLVKSAKLYFYDTGLACHLLRISREQLPFHYLRGELFESHVITEVHKNYYNAGKRPDLYFWRKLAGQEVDLLVEHKGMICPVEIKASTTIPLSFFAGLTYWNKSHNSDPKNGFLVYGGTQTQRRSKGNVLGWRSVSEIRRYAEEKTSA